MTEQELLIKYNELIYRLEKADNFLQSPTYFNKKNQIMKYKDIEQEFQYKSKFFDEYNLIIKELSSLQNIYKKLTGEEMQEQERLYGFSIYNN